MLSVASNLEFCTSCFLGIAIWILTPTTSSKILENIGGKTDGNNWGEGVYLLAPFLITGLVVIHQLPETLYQIHA